MVASKIHFLVSKAFLQHQQLQVSTIDKLKSHIKERKEAIQLCYIEKHRENKDKEKRKTDREESLIEKKDR